MEGFKRVLDLTWSKGKDLFNWLSNLKNFVLSNGYENVRNVIEMVPIASGGWWLRPQAPFELH